MQKFHNRNDFVQYCKKEVAKVLQNSKRYYIEYKRKRSRQPIGVVVVFTNAGEEFFLGWSLCRSNDLFNRYIGLVRAFNNSVPLKDIVTYSGNIRAYLPPCTMKPIPDSVKALVDRIAKRANRLIKPQLPPINTEGELPLEEAAGAMYESPVPRGL